MKIDEMICGAQTIAIAGHLRPDGDCVGSTLALFNYISGNYPEKQVALFLEPPTNKLSFLKGFNKIDSKFNADGPFDLMFSLDTASFDRLGAAGKIFRKAAHTINIDHHVSNEEFADENYVYPDASSCSEVLYGYLDRSKIDRDIAIELYTGIVYDTGVFKYPATSPATMRVAADLMEYDIPTNYIVDNCFYAKTYNENRIFGYVVTGSRLISDGRIIYSIVTKDDLNKFGVKSRELDGVIAQLKLTIGVQIAICFHEINPGEYKISFRSGDEVDVNVLAGLFGGGGHARASGATISGSLDYCVERVLAAAEGMVK